MKGSRRKGWRRYKGSAADGGQEQSNRKTHSAKADEGAQGGSVPRQQRVRQRRPVPGVSGSTVYLWARLAWQLDDDLTHRAHARFSYRADTNDAAGAALPDGDTPRLSADAGRRGAGGREPGNTPGGDPSRILLQ